MNVVLTKSMLQSCTHCKYAFPTRTSIDVPSGAHPPHRLSDAHTEAMQYVTARRPGHDIVDLSNVLGPFIVLQSN